MSHTKSCSVAAHTPGPWKIGSSNEVFPDGEGGESFSEWLNVVGPDGRTICELPGHSQYARGSDLSRKEDADAALIAAAPELLEALSSLLSVPEVRKAAANWASDEILKARLAIAKAEGKR